MTRTVLAYLLKLVILLLLQVVIFNNIVLFGVAIPFVYIYSILSMPITWSTNISITIGFLTGMTLDIFTNTPGMNALACTVLAFARKPIFHLYQQHDEDLSGAKPGQSSMGTPSFLKYASTMTLLFCLLIFILDAFCLFNPLRFIEQVVGSSFLTVLAIYALDSITTRQHEKRL